MQSRTTTPFFGFYCGVPMTGQTPPETLLRASDAAVRQAVYSPDMTPADAEGLLNAAAMMREAAAAVRP